MTWIMAAINFILGLMGYSKGTSDGTIAAQEAERAGGAEQRASDATAAAQSEARVAQSEAQDAGQTSADVDKRISDGTF
jgi:hypothetical protein